MTTVTTPSAELTTGWEPDLPVTDSLLRRFVFAYADRIARMARRTGGRTEAVGDARYADLASPFPFDNAVVLLRPPTDVDLEAVTTRARAFFPPGRGVLLSVWPTRDLSWLGLRLVGHPPLMFRPAGPWPAAPPELEVVEVDGPVRQSEFERTLLASFGFPPVAGGSTTTVADPRLLGEVVRLFVGSVAGEPVAVAGAAVNHGLVEVDWVGTLPHARGHGYGAALTAAAAGIAPDLPTVLLATDPGRPGYQRLGFIDLLRATMWEVHP